ncbi:MAG: DUF4252 domain-containing protein [Bacteroidales bacterium]|nr:DUF4252 domain-containing protein [Bacteroidales bacterium]
MKYIKHIIILMLIILSGIIFQSFTTDHTTKINALMRSYRHEHGFFGLTVPTWIVRPFIKHEGEEVQFLFKKIKKIRFLVTTDELNQIPLIQVCKSDFVNELNKSFYADLLQIKNNTDEVLIKGKIENDTIYEIIIMVKDSEDFVIISLKGEIRMDDFQRVVNNDNFFADEIRI